MAWTTDNIYQYVRFLTKKNQSGGISATDLFYAWNPHQKQYQSDLLGRWQARSNGKEGANTGLIENETIMTKLAAFVTPVTLTIATGTSNKPSGFAYELALRINNAKVFKVTHDEVWAMLDDVIDPPSIPNDSYYYTEYLGYYKFYPTTVTTAELDYIATPTDIVWGYTFDVDGRQVYNPATSVQPQWLDADIEEITRRTLKTLGVRFKDSDFANFGQSAIVTGD